MVILDTNALIFDALAPRRLSRPAHRAIEKAYAEAMLACCDISLWEIAMLTVKERLDPGKDIVSFLKLMLTARNLRVLAIVPEIAELSVRLEDVNPDPADRIIAATAVYHQAALITRDKNLRAAGLPVNVVW